MDISSHRFREGIAGFRYGLGPPVPFLRGGQARPASHAGTRRIGVTSGLRAAPATATRTCIPAGRAWPPRRKGTGGTKEPNAVRSAGAHNHPRRIPGRGVRS